MERFLRELEKAENYLDDSIDRKASEAVNTYGTIADKFRPYIGKRALYKSKSLKDSRLVTIDEVTPRYIMVSYKYFGEGYEGRIKTCINYPSLFSGDDVLEVEDLV